MEGGNMSLLQSSLVLLIVGQSIKQVKRKWMKSVPKYCCYCFLQSAQLPHPYFLKWQPCMFGTRVSSYNMGMFSSLLAIENLQDYFFFEFFNFAFWRNFATELNGGPTCGEKKTVRNIPMTSYVHCARDLSALGFETKTPVRGAQRNGSPWRWCPAPAPWPL
jgi:hypothetical protein